MANDWQKQYAPKHHQEIGGFLGNNPGDESRIGSALGIDPIPGWDGATTGDTGAIPGEIDWMPQAPPQAPPYQPIDSPYGGDPLPPANINDPVGANPLYDQIIGGGGYLPESPVPTYGGYQDPLYRDYDPSQHQEISRFLGNNPGDESRIGSALGFNPIEGGGYLPEAPPLTPPDGLQETKHAGPVREYREAGNVQNQYAPPPIGEGYGYSLGFRPSDIDPKYGEMTDAEYLAASGGFPTWESLGTPGLADMGDPMSLVQNQSVGGLVPAMQEAGYQFQQDPYDTRMAGVPDYNVFYGDQQIPFGLRQQSGQEPPTVVPPVVPPTTPTVAPPVVPSVERKTITDPTLSGKGGGTSQPGAMSGGDQYPGSELLSMIGDIPIDSQSAPLYPGEFQDIFTTEVANDPLSRKANLALENLIGTGGVVSTPFTAQAEQKLSEILDRGGETTPTEGEASIFRNLSDVVSGYGEAPPTTLEAEQQQLLNELISSGGKLPQDDQRLAMQVEAARSPLDILRRSQLEQGQAAMAQRGLLGQGPEADYMERLEGKLAPMYTQAAQQIALEEGERSDERYNLALQQLNQQATTQRLSTDQRYAQARSLQTDMALDRAGRQDERLQNAIQTASNLTMEQSRNLVDSVNALSGVQKIRQDAAVEMLGKNMEWNKFLAEYGLERDKTMEALQQGRYEFMLPLIQEYMKAAAMSAEGYVSGTSG